MEPFATISDLESEWRPLSPDERDTAEHRLSTASLLIRRLKPGVDDEVEDDDVFREVVTYVVCDMVKNSMTSKDVPPGVSQFTHSTGPFSQSMQFANPEENLYFKKMHRRLLGLDDESFTIDLLGGPSRPSELRPLGGETWV